MKFLFILSSFLIVFSVNAQEKTTISGKVTGENAKPIEGANLVIEGSIDGTITDEAGNFEFETKKTGQQNLLITAIEYAEKIQLIEITAGVPVVLNIKLSKGEIKTDEIIVTASSYTSGSNSQVTLTPLEIVRIPGADADLYRAITTFPGSNQVDEGSRIAVRGGDPNEVLTIIDQATLYNPFIFDDTFNESAYSTINPWGLRGINFTSGGFSSRFGNSLSAVLDLKSYNMPRGKGMFAWLGLANASLAGVYLTQNGEFGATFSAGKLFLQPYFAINGEHTEYSPIPQSNSFGGTLSYKLGQKGFVKFYGNYNDDKIGILNNSPSFHGYYNSRSKSYFTNLAFILFPSANTSLNASVSYSLYDRFLQYGILDTRSKDIYSKGRVDLTYQLDNKFDINTGAEYEYDGNEVEGKLPSYSYNLKLNAPSFQINDKAYSGRLGGYIEGQWRVTSNFFIIPGIRTDYHTSSGEISFDPRLSLGYRIGDHHFIRSALGIYHQYPRPQYYINRSTFQTIINPEAANHYILGYEFNNDGKLIFRIEGYYKDYKDLIVYNTIDQSYSSRGKGIAKGIDIFFKAKIDNKFTGWISYALTDSKREQYVLKLSSANYDITHSVSVVGSYNVTESIVTGMSLKTSTGKPYTPVTGSEYIPAQDIYSPFYGERNSARFPTYFRVDMNAQYIFSLLGRFAVAVIAVNNILNHKNLYGYTYNSDYSEQIEIVSLNRRSVYMGLGVQF
jgi:vitamin B12 transporter